MVWLNEHDYLKYFHFCSRNLQGLTKCYVVCGEYVIPVQKLLPKLAVLQQQVISILF